MRPRYLEIEGLHSFKEKQSIDFDKLGETGLFGIFGCTGSGKSSILDAITLSLYGNVQRALRGTQGIINTDCDTVRVSFSFDLSKDQKTDTYKIERVYKRKKGSDTAVEAKIARLFKLCKEGSIPLVDKPSEVTAKIEALIGLQLEDFTRTVVLPQNKFQEFLLLEKAKKRDMLEKIFFLEEYGRQLVERVAKRLSTTKLSLAHIEGSMTALGECSEKLLLEAESSMKSAKHQRDAIELRLKQTEEAFNEGKEVWTLSNELNQVLVEIQRQGVFQEEIQHKRGLLEKLAQAMSMEELMVKHQEAKKNLEETQRLLEEVHQKLGGTRVPLEQAREAYANHHEEAEKEKPLLFEKKAKLQEALILQKEVAVMATRLFTLREEYQALKQQLTVIENEYGKNMTVMEGIEHQWQETQKAFDMQKVDALFRSELHIGAKIQEECMAQTKEHQKLETRRLELLSKLEALNHQRVALKQQSGAVEETLAELVLEEQQMPLDAVNERNRILESMEKLHATKVVSGTLQMLHRDQQAIQNKLGGIKTQREEQRKAYTVLCEKREALSNSVEQLKNQQEALRKECDRDVAFLLATGLQEGEGCPVCGSLTHPALAIRPDRQESGALVHRLEDIQAEVEKQVQLLKRAENEGIQLEEQIKTSEAQIIEFEKQLEQKQTEKIELQIKLPEPLQAMGDADIQLAIEKLTLENEMRQQDLTRKEAQLIKRQHTMIALQESLSQLKAEEAGLTSQWDAVMEQDKDTMHLQNELLQRSQKTQSEYSAFIAKHGILDALEELKKIEQRDQQIEILQKTMEQLQRDQKSVQNTLLELSEQRQQKNSQFDAVRLEGEALNRQTKEKEEKIKAVTLEQDIAMEIEATKKRIETRAEREKILLETVKSLETMDANFFAQKKSLEDQQGIYQSVVSKEQDRLQRALVENGFLGIEEVKQCLMMKDQQEAIRQEIMSFEKIQQELDTRKSLLDKKLNGRAISNASWQEIEKQLEESKREKESAIQSLESAKNHYKQRRERFDAWAKLKEALGIHQKKQELLEQIQRLLKGNSFIEYILEERLRYIAKEASETLGVLTKYRYTIELDSENGFIIRDHFNGGVLRAVASLSGGETFLTSLSLALALSKQIQLKGQSPLRFFFLDEGFGTLDASLLDTVMDALFRLSTQDRVIGLISHVPELRNRMTRRLIVQPPSPEGAGSCVHIEKA